MEKIETEASQRAREDEPTTTTTRLGLRKGGPARSLQRLQAPLVVKDSDVVGRDGDKEEIIELLLSDDTSSKKLSVIPIVGMGGIGKTTLHFELKAWVTVSEEFDVFQISKAILEELTFQKCNIGELFQLQIALHKALAGKKFLFVLDDVWNENYRRWDSLKSAFQSGAYGSRIIVTTRSRDVALTLRKGVMHELKLVSDEDCWRIFKKHAFGDSAEATAELQEIGRNIVARCKGLPLAVNSVTGLLRSTSNAEEWRKILNSDIWRLQVQENLKKGIAPALWLSFHFLPPVLKRCFAYCSIFPKDYEFGKSDMEKIIWLWMAEGLLQPEKGGTREDVGKAYLQALISRSFFQYSSGGKLVMHDIVHDLATFIAGEFSFELGECNNLNDLPPKTRHLSYRKGSEVFTKVKGLTSQTKSLRTLLALPLSLENVEHESILEKSFLHELCLKVGGCLRVLSLSRCQITELPDSVGNTKYLRYLDLSCTEVKEIPDSICTLYNLQTLLLSQCGYLERLPTSLASLVNLRRLDIRGTYRIKEMPPQMCQMKSLQRLSDFVLGENDSWRIKELGELPLLGGSLCISGLNHIVDNRDVLDANLKDKKFLSELILEWRVDSHITSSQQDREVLEALQPHTNLKELTIRGYRGTIFPDWWSFSSDRLGQEGGVFPSLTELDISGCNKLIVGLPDCHLPSLKSIDFCRCDEMLQKALGKPHEVGSGKVAVSYDIISLANRRGGGFLKGLNGQAFQHLTSLQKLSIGSCRELECLPQEGLPDSLSCLTIVGCPEVLKRWGVNWLSRKLRNFFA
ncbi:hypothetical protein UlMin_003888 [Ulmus minor]